MNSHELRRLRRLLQSADQRARDWQVLQVYTQPAMGFGFFLLALGLPMLTSALTEPRLFVLVPRLASATLFVVWGSVALVAPFQIQAYFSTRPEKLSDLFGSLSKSESAAVPDLVAFLSRQEGDQAIGLRAAARSLRFALTLGLTTAAIFAILMILSYLSSVWLLARTQSSTGAVLLAIAPLVLALIAWLLVVRRRNRRSEGPSFA